MKIILRWTMTVALAMAIPACGQEPPAKAPAMALKDVKSFMYQLQNLDGKGAVAALAKSDYDMIVVEPTSSVKGDENFDTKKMVEMLHAGKKGRIVLAYLNPGQAEDYRTYWKKEWRAPTRTAGGNPDFILMPDPDGWKGNYNVAFWSKGWQEVFATGKQSEVRTAMAAGFDGVYLDWIDAYNEDATVAAARRAGVNPATAMVDFLLLIRKTAQEKNSNAIVIQQNAIYLLDADLRLREAIDGVGVEDTWFSGRPNAEWGSKEAGDIPNIARDESSTAARLKQYEKLKMNGKPVFTLDYCRDPKNVAAVYAAAKQHGLVSLVTQISLSKMTETPPPAK